ncbi:hypothetical protein AB0M11_14485 [Streptomyces sp. NPDC051987]|uniref:hypothetical protein n=1 Tax=Streptomyces sp. NPDC051987 TaxID=3155808 RepID=UPI00341D182C
MVGTTPAAAGTNGQQIAWYVPLNSEYANGTLVVYGYNQNGTWTNQTVHLGAGGTNTYDPGWWWRSAYGGASDAVRMFYYTSHGGSYLEQDVTIPTSCNVTYFPINVPRNSSGAGGGPGQVSC